MIWGMASTVGIEVVLHQLAELIPLPWQRPNLSPELRYGAYRDFRHAVLRTLLALDLWTETNPSLLGGFWSFPVALGSYRRYLAGLQEVTVTFAEIVCLGTPEIAEKAEEVTKVLLKMNQSIRQPRWNERKKTPVRLLDYDERRNEVLAAVREFMVLTTEDLGERRKPNVATRRGDAPPS
jgi:hypothetical protein